ncbi:hypothetical protein [Pseudonocardia parietis]|nr:hypothetical protein [Pseudonocardia parietis]
MRLLLSPKWMAWHVLTLGAMATCGFLAVWQWGRAGSAMGSALNIGYGLQWPLFAVFFGVMWWRFLRLEVADVRAREAATPAEPDTAPAATSATPATTTAPATAERPSGADPAPVPELAGAAVADRPSPFTSRPAGVAARRGTDPQLRAYNEELARLAVRPEESTP